MGSNDVSQKFTFNELPEGSSVGVTYKNNDIITMDIVGNANGVHEATHGYQIFKSGGITKSGKFDAEVSAYQRQFSFSPLSVQTIPSSGGTISYRSNINSYWVAGINDNGKYIYMPGFKK